jgi:outer membrane protein OmpA-like peptidoglycan-associated protein
MNILRKLLILLIFIQIGLQSKITAQSNEMVTLQLKNEETVNTKGLDFSPTFFEDGIVFISTNSAGVKKMRDDKLKTNTMSILRSKRGAEGTLSTPEPFSKELTTRFHEGPVCFDRTGERIFFSRNILKNGREKHARDGEQKMKLYMAQKSGETWAEATPLPISTDEFDDCHPSISIEGDKLFFASDRPGGLGGMDLYVTFKLGESWSEPINLGATINTKGNETFPFLHADNTLYFASDEQGGQGGFDLYYAIPEGTEWTKPVNLGAPFNTKGDDFGLIVDLDKKNGYFSSNGNGGLGSDDIFSFHSENGNLDDYLLQNQRGVEGSFELLTVVFDKETSTPLQNATVKIINLDQNNVIGRDSNGNLITLQKVDGQDIMKVMEESKGVVGMTDAAGRFSTMLKPGNYVILSSKDRYQSKQIIQKVKKSNIENSVSLEKATGKVRWNAALFNDQTNSPLAGATLILKNKATGKIDTISTDAAGNVDYYLDKNADYDVAIYQNGVQIGSTKLNTAGWENGGAASQSGKMTLNITAPPLAAGTIIELPNIYYNYNDASLRPDAQKDLALVISLLRQYPQLRIEIGSHTDSRGTEPYNLDLSRKRATNVMDYLAGKGISPLRLEIAGYGEAVIRNQCKDGVACSEKDHARNRRTEIKVLSGAEGAIIKSKEGSLGLGKRVNEAPQNNNVTVSSNSNVDYYVIAGSFLMESRASNQSKVLINAGYLEVAVMQFKPSPFYSVIVKKAATMEEAQSTRRQVASKTKLSSYVKPIPK